MKNLIYMPFLFVTLLTLSACSLFTSESASFQSELNGHLSDMSDHMESYLYLVKEAVPEDTYIKDEDLALQIELKSKASQNVIRKIEDMEPYSSEEKRYDKALEAAYSYLFALENFPEALRTNDYDSTNQCISAISNAYDLLDEIEDMPK